MFKKKPDGVKNPEPDTLQTLIPGVFVDPRGNKVDESKPKYYGKPHLNPATIVQGHIEAVRKFEAGE